MNNLAEFQWLIDAAIGLASSIAGFFIGRQKKKNDFLSELQSSIDMLSKKNAEQMDEILKLREQVVILREENLELRKSQERLIVENTQLKAEVVQLRKENKEQSERIEQLQEQLRGVKTITKSK
jgi:uncharacterized coiled-coil DUF342 family protein